MKVFAREPDSGPLREYWALRSPGKHTTPFCFYETLSILKGKWVHGNWLTKPGYLEASSNLFAWYATTKLSSDIDLHDSETFKKVHDLADCYSLDLSDALQILSVKAGRFSSLAGDSQTILITADKALAKAARAEGLRVWYCIGEPEP